MKKFLYLFLAFFLLSCGGGSDQSTNISSDTSKKTSTIMKVTTPSVLSEMKKGSYKEGELLVKFKSDVVKTFSLKTHQRMGSAVIKRFNIVPNLELIKLPEGMSVEEAILHYMSDPSVEYAEPNFIRCASVVPNDTYFGNQWALYNTGSYAGGTSGADIRAPWAWDITTGSKNIVIAVLDSGIDYNHEDLVGNIWTNSGETDCNDDIDNDVNAYIDDCVGWDFANDDNNPMDDDGHGTHVAGIIGAKSNNNLGIAGVMWYVKLMPIKIFNADTQLTGSCTSVYASDEIAGIEYAVNNGARIINASINGEGYCISEYNAISYADSKGVLFIAAAGNGGADLIGDNNDLTPHYPSSYPLLNIISVTATDQNDRRASFSNFGLESVDVAAPGVYILSTVPNNIYLDGEYLYLNKDFYAGTSMAAPHVAGLAGLLMSYYDGYYNSRVNHYQIRDTILRYVDVLDTLNGWIKTGGRINVYRAVSSLLTPTNLTATAISPTEVNLSWSDNATGEDGYRIERMVSGESWNLLTTLPADSSSYKDYNVVANTTYTYRVRAFNNIGESINSSEATVTTPEKKHTGGGGSCSIGGNQNTPSAMANLAVILIPLMIFIAIMRRRR
jgi:subtilisin family serine protease